MFTTVTYGNANKFFLKLSYDLLPLDMTIVLTKVDKIIKSHY